MNLLYLAPEIQEVAVLAAHGQRWKAAAGSQPTVDCCDHGLAKTETNVARIPRKGLPCLLFDTEAIPLIGRTTLHGVCVGGDGQRVEVPDADGVRSGHDVPAVWGHDGKLDAGFVPEEVHFLARGGIPNAGRLIVGRGDDKSAVRAQQRGLQRRRMAAEGHELFAGLHVEQAEAYRLYASSFLPSGLNGLSPAGGLSISRPKHRALKADQLLAARGVECECRMAKKTTRLPSGSKQATRSELLFSTRIAASRFRRPIP